MVISVETRSGSIYAFRPQEDGQVHVHAFPKTGWDYTFMADKMPLMRVGERMVVDAVDVTRSLDTSPVVDIRVGR